MTPISVPHFLIWCIGGTFSFTLQSSPDESVPDPAEGLCAGDVNIWQLQRQQGNSFLLTAAPRSITIHPINSSDNDSPRIIHYHLLNNGSLDWDYFWKSTAKIKHKVAAVCRCVSTHLIGR